MTTNRASENSWQIVLRWCVANKAPGVVSQRLFFLRLLCFSGGDGLQMRRFFKLANGATRAHDRAQ
jgi:hypothetical protein